MEYEEFSRDYKNEQLGEYGISSFFFGFAIAAFLASLLSDVGFLMKLFLALIAYFFAHFASKALIRLAIIMKLI